MLPPEVVEPVVELLQLGGEGGIASLAERAPELGSVAAQPVDLIVNLVEGRHIRRNAEPIFVIPYS